MAASLKVSELSQLSSIVSDDKFLITDTSASASKYIEFSDVEGAISLANLSARSINDLSDVSTSGLSDGQVLVYNQSNSRFEPGNRLGATIATATRATDATHYITFVTDDNVSATQESVYTDAGIAYNPSSNILTVGEVSATTLDIGGTNITATAAELNILDGVTSTAAELNILDGVTSTTAELNILDGVTATASELNILDGVTSTASELNILDGVTSTAAELNILDGVTATTAELNYSDGVTSNIQTQLDAKQATVTAGDGLAFSGATMAVDLASAIVANEQFVLSGMSDSNHNATYSMVYRSGTRLKATFDQSGSSIKISTQREAPYFIDISGTELAAANGETLTVIKNTGYVTRSGTTYTWNIGSTGGNFFQYYWNTTSQIFVAYNSTDTEWTVFDLDEATGNASSFISDLDSTGSNPGYISSGENFTLADSHKDTLSNSSTNYPDEIVYVPSDSGHVAYQAASDHPYYVFQNSDATKWVIFSRDPSFYWTALYRSSAFDLTTESLTDDQTAFTLDSVSHFEFITTDSDSYAGANIPDADYSGIAYSSAAGASYLEFSSNKLAVSVKDEDNMSSNSADHVPTQQSVKAYVDANETHIDNIMTLLGETKDDTNLSTFTGSTISDNGTVRAALQELETAVDNALGGGAAAASVNTITRSVDASHYLAFVTDDNSSATQENIYTDAGIQYNPSSNILTVGEIVISGNLTVNGSTTTIESTTLSVDDKNITLGTVANPTDTTADGGGFTLKGATDKTFNWVNATDSFTASEHIDLASGKAYYIDNASVLNATTLGTAVVNSSLTSVGTLTSLTVSGNTDLQGHIDIDKDDLRIDSTAVTTTAAELNILDGVTATTAELNILDGVTSTAAEINKLDGVTATTAELNYLDVSTLGVSENSKAVTQNGSGAITIGATDGNQTIDIACHDLADGGLKLAGTLVTASAAEINLLDGVTATTAELNILDGVTATATELNYVDGVTSAIQTQINTINSTATEIDTNANDLITLSGVAENATNLGSFNGTIIADNETIKGALQDLEDQLGNITLTNLNINGGSAITITDADKVPFYDASGTTNGNTTATLLADYVASKKTVKELANVGTTADSEPTNYYFLAVDASNGNIVILNKQFVETEGSP